MIDRVDDDVAGRVGAGFASYLLPSKFINSSLRKTSTQNYGIGYLSRDDDIGEEESVQRHEDSTSTASQGLGEPWRQHS